MKIHRDVILRALLVCLLVLISNRLLAADCDSEAHRAFDFWLGEWQVRTPDGKLAGSNHITREYKGCILRERYQTASGYRGESINTYDASRQLWHQTWIDNVNTLLLLEGGIREGRMVLEGETRDSNGKITRHRISWTANADGSVRQFWQATDSKGRWQTSFDGLYSRN